MVNPFDDFRDSPTAPARRAFVIVPSDSDPLPLVTKAIRADGNGVITLRPVGSTVEVAHPVLGGERIDVRTSHVRATGTTGQTIIIGYA
ncbi:spike base protein, RCAP_Rcc01079 family [Sphingomonas sp. FW199]|uniref:spike base protein, RCAP_Rcc01079 family n=1 Tax=Sphingomonas sp. FW199 TaxID=3400217 RepID=UPI003CEE6A1B